MKIRKGFVSNSSSSSFICEVCGNVESGYDASASELGFVECENGHSMCFVHVKITEEQVTAFAERLLNGDRKCELNQYYTIDNYDDEAALLEALKEEIRSCFGKYEYSQSTMEDLCGLYEMPGEFCPICALQAVSDDDMLLYILKENNSTKKFILDKIQANFKNYTEFAEYLKAK